MTTLAQQHDCLLLDLDGTLFRGAQPTTGAVETLAAVDRPARCTSPTTPRGAPTRSPTICARWDSPLNPTTWSPAPRVPRICWHRNSPPTPRYSSSAPTRSPLRSPPSACSRCASSPTRRSPSSRATRRTPAGPIWPRRRWRFEPAHCGWRPTWTGPCRPNADCCPATGRWSRPCAPPPKANRASPASRNRRSSGCVGRAAVCAPLVVGDRLDTDIAGANAAGAAQPDGAHRCQHRRGGDVRGDA